jgi:hypothetical protein
VNAFLFSNKSISITGTTFNVPAITQSIVDQGLVLVYMGTSSSGPWYPLPYTQGGTTISLLSYNVGTITVIASTNQTNIYLKVVVIPGNSLTQLNVANPHLNYNNYNQVASALRLK